MSSQDDIERRRATAMEELQNLLNQGLVEPVLLFPAEFGGIDIPSNVTWLPPNCIREKQEFDAAVLREVQRGKGINYTATPSYDGYSLVPSRLSLAAYGDDINLSREIDVAQCRTW